MSIPESQLEVWSNRGAETTAAATHHTVRLAINNGIWTNGVPDTYLQGSYRNSTNIRGDSDVDIVAQMNNFYYSNTDLLDETQIRAFKSAKVDAPYTWHDFLGEALAVFYKRFGFNAVARGKKCLTIAPEQGRLSADVLVCFEYRNYLRFRSLYDQQYVSGIIFYIPTEGRWAVNYPKQHIAKGEAKNASTYGRYKPTVRMFKNARSVLVENGELEKKKAPSYFLEGMLSNVPDSYYCGTYANRYVSILDWLCTAFSAGLPDKFTCQNGQQWLFGNTEEQWNAENASYTIGKLLDLWSGW